MLLQHLHLSDLQLELSYKYTIRYKVSTIFYRFAVYIFSKIFSIVDDDVTENQYIWKAINKFHIPFLFQSITLKYLTSDIYEAHIDFLFVVVGNLKLQILKFLIEPVRHSVSCEFFCYFKVFEKDIHPTVKFYFSIEKVPEGDSFSKSLIILTIPIAQYNRV